MGAPGEEQITPEGVSWEGDDIQLGERSAETGKAGS